MLPNFGPGGSATTCMGIPKGSSLRWSFCRTCSWNTLFWSSSAVVSTTTSQNGQVNSLLSFPTMDSNHMSSLIRKPAFCICENKGADLLRGDRAADQHLCFRYIDSTIPLLHPLLHKYQISSTSWPALVVQPGLCRTLSATPKTGFLTT